MDSLTPRLNDRHLRQGFLSRRHALLATGIVLGTGLAASGAEEESVDPRLFGFNIPAGKTTAGDGRCVMTTDAEGASVVARLHVEIGAHRVVMLPDGQLVLRATKDAADTERPFAAIAKADLAKRLSRGPLAGFKSKETRRYLYLYNTSDEFAVVTQRIMESMHPGIVNYFETQRLNTKPSDVPLVVLMFRKEDQFQAYQRMPPGVVAYYNGLTNHIVMYEQARIPPPKPEMAIQQSISTIAHEGVHQILNNIGVQKRLSVWPMWLGEGLAEYFAPTEVGKKMNWKGAGQVNDLRMCELEMYLQGRDSDTPDGHLISQTVSARQLSSTGYASAWALTMYLAKQDRVKFHRYIAEVSKLGPLQGNVKVTGRGIIQQNLEAFQSHFGDNLADMEKKLVTYLKKLDYQDPFADWPHYAAMVVGTLNGKVKREASVFHSADVAERWRQETATKLSADKAQATVQPFANRALAERAAGEFLRSRK